MANDRKYLDEVQYKDSGNLRKRANLFTRYGKSDWFGFLAAAADFEGGQSVLDIGCGAGWFWTGAASTLPAELDITLADTSEGMVGEALERVRDLRLSGTVDARVADVCDLPFPDRSFDRVLAFHMLYHAGDQEAAMREIARVLKPGGMALISTNGETSTDEIDSLRNAAFDLPGGPVINFTLENAPRLLKTQFSDIELKRSGEVLNVTDSDDVLAYLTSFPPGDRAPAPQIERLQGLVADAFARGNGALAVTVDRGVFRCRI
jgi:SAM-dependent methyltransferase